MKYLIDSLQDVLLIFSIIVLVYVLYSRLLLLLGKNKNKKLFAMTGEKLVWKNDKTPVMEIDLPTDMHVDVEVWNTDHQQVLQAVSENCKQGKHHFEINCTSLPAGRYYLKIKSDAQESSLYFSLS